MRSARSCAAFVPLPADTAVPLKEVGGSADAARLGADSARTSHLQRQQQQNVSARMRKQRKKSSNIKKTNH